MIVDIDIWLDRIGLGRYVELFRANDIDATLLRTLTGDDLKELGVASLGHRKKLLESIAALSATPDDSLSTAIGAADAAPIADPGAERRQLTVMFADVVGATS